MPVMPTATKQHLRSKRGRPQGSFRDPALRAQAWHWLSELLLVTGETDPRRLDDAQAKHGLSRGLPVARRFTRVMEDGYDPRNISAGDRQLFDRLKKRPKFSRAKAAYNHPLFKYMQDRDLGSSQDWSWMRDRLKAMDVALISDRDHEVCRTLGLVSADGWLWGDRGKWSCDAESLLRPLTRQVERFATLDGLHLLVALYRFVIDTALADIDVSRHLANLIRAASTQLANTYRYAPEQKETWQFLTESRLIRWLPEFKVSEAEVASALSELDLDLRLEARSPTGRPKLSPYEVGRGRAERRWRRWAYIRAANAKLRDQTVPWALEQRSVATDWIEQNGELMDRHLHKSWLQWVDHDDPLRDRALPALQIPKEVVEMRHLPPDLSPMDRSFYTYYGLDIGPSISDHMPIDDSE